MNNILNWANNNEKLLLRIFIIIFIVLFTWNEFALYKSALLQGIDLFIAFIILTISFIVLLISFLDKDKKYESLKITLAFITTLIVVYSNIGLQSKLNNMQKQINKNTELIK